MAPGISKGVTPLNPPWPWQTNNPNFWDSLLRWLLTATCLVPRLGKKILAAHRSRVTGFIWEMVGDKPYNPLWTCAAKKKGEIFFFQPWKASFLSKNMLIKLDDFSPWIRVNVKKILEHITCHLGVFVLFTIFWPEPMPMHLKLWYKYSALVETTLVRLQHSVDGSEMVPSGKLT